MKYDAIIIGAGQSGPFIAARLEGQGKKVALVEGAKIGGSCVNYGCIPTKTLIASARAIYMAGRGDEFGFSTGPIEVDFEAVMARKDRRVDDAQGGFDGWMRSLENMDVYDGFGSFVGTKDGVHQVKVNDDTLEAEQVFINTGGRAFVPPIPGLKDVDYVDNRGILALKHLPKELVILGGGYIGLEFAQAFRRFGSEVTVVEMAPRLAIREDEDISAEVLSILENEGIRILTGHKANEVSQDENGRKFVSAEDENGKAVTIEGTDLLVAVGRRPNSEALNLDAVGVKVDGRGYIQVNNRLETNVAGIWAVGDVNGRGAFTHTSYQDHEIVVANLEGGDRSLNERNMAYAVYIDPPLGRVGMNEREARESGRPVLTATKPMSHIGRALEQGESQGMIKLLVDAETEQFLGATVLGYHGDDVIQVLSYYMATGATYHAMKNALPVHPTISELLPTILGELQPLE